ncbi:MAG: hypothetical protein BWX97_00542 [Firmicutes bacterium ADurb.Bin146]|nr:MAG: hypothetical protein BWX97_00542 [Firmicutes bacterium ADurb.Bin146]
MDIVTQRQAELANIFPKSLYTKFDIFNVKDTYWQGGTKNINFLFGRYM